MTQKDFLQKVQDWLNHQRPFVLYRKGAPTEETTFNVKGIFQQNDRLYTAEDFTESGFVMAPFDFEKPSVLIPANQSEELNAAFTFSDDIHLGPPEFKEGQADKSTHIDLVSKGVETIKKQHLQKVVLSRKITVPTKRAPLQLFQRLLRYYPTAFVYAWYHPKVGFWMGATPETLLKLTGHKLQTMALAGTKKVENNTKPQWTPKEIEEQERVTDFIKATLDGQVTDLTIGAVENIRAGNLWHLKCDISGRLKSKENLKEILEDFHPTPAVCGTPKLASKRFILNHETYKREFYTGFIGELNLKSKPVRKANRRNIENQAYTPPREHTELFVNLRCMQLDKNQCHIYVGGGVVKDSIPEKEWEETVNKSRTMIDVL